MKSLPLFPFLPTHELEIIVPLNGTPFRKAEPPRLFLVEPSPSDHSMDALRIACFSALMHDPIYKHLKSRSAAMSTIHIQNT